MKKNYKDRNILFRFLDEEMHLKAKVDRTGFTSCDGGGLAAKTVLLKDIVRYEDGMLIAHHLWIKKAELTNIDEFGKELKKGKTIVFSAYPYDYIGNYRGRLTPKYSLSDINIEEVRDDNMMMDVAV